MMNGNHPDMVSLSKSEQERFQQQSLGQIESLSSLIQCDAHSFIFCVEASQSDKVNRRRSRIPGRDDGLHWRSLHDAEGGAQRFVTFDNLVERPLEQVRS